MKRIAANLTVLIVVVLLFSAAGYAQFVEQPVLKADVPFEFSIGKKTFPAGEYGIVRIAPHTLALRDSSNGFLTSVVTGSVVSLRARSTPKLKFEFEDGRYALTEVWPDGTATGYQLSVPKRLASYAQNKPAATEVRASASASNGK